MMKPVTLFLICCSVTTIGSADTKQPFVHPGLLHSASELEFIKKKLIAEGEPWKSAWDQLQSSKLASLDYTPKPFAKVVRGPSNRPDIGSSNMSNDAAAAYAHALQWSLTGKKAHATKAIEILNAWAKTLQSVSGHDARLLIGMDGVAFCNAAELIRHTSTEWSSEDQEQFERMLRQVLYPVIKDFYPTANGNWDASMIQTMIAMGIFLDDRAMFDRAVAYYRNGKGNGAITKYINESGQCQESGRDQLHVQMGLGFLACACEMAWKQSVDLYGAADNRLALGFEYTAKYNLGEDVPCERYRSVEGRYDYRSISRRGRGRLRPIFERAVHHYHGRLGLKMPFSRRVAEKQRPEDSHDKHMSWGTLTSYGLPTRAEQTTNRAKRSDSSQENKKRPLVLGHGVGLFKVGSLLAEDQFENLDNWVVQVQERSGFEPARVEARNGSLDCFVPGRGSTVWFKKKLPTRVTITYDVLCPTHEPAIKGVQPRDINNFWMATDPVDPDQGLFDSKRYTGAFKTYDKMHSYYASTGGASNRTTRMRRYPREANEEPAEHVALNDKDDKPCYLITPNRTMTVQLVAYDDVIQYIVDGKLVYQIGRGDKIQTEGRDDNGRPVVRNAEYDLDRFLVYRKSYFGFRMVGTHHIYSNFKVHVLEPEEDGRRRPTVRVSSLRALREAVSRSNQQIVLEPGDYKVPDRRGFHFSGSNNDVDLTGVHIEVPLDVASARTVFRLTGNHITLRGGTIENTYPDGKTEVTDFGGYNQGKKYGGMNEMSISGDDNRVVCVKMIVRGSFPYGYGNMYGIGGGAAVGLSKHCGIQVTGDRIVIDGCDIKMEAFGHAIYVQGGDRTTIRNTIVEGTVRPSNDCYDEKDRGDLAGKFNYQIQWPKEVKGLPIPRDHMLNCTEDGIRAYKGAGHMEVENCVVKKCRGGIKLYMARSAKVSNCHVLDCVVQGYSLPSKGVISNSSGNAAYGPLLYVHSDSHFRQTIDLKVLPSPHGLGDHPLAAIKGRGHSISFMPIGQQAKETLRPIIVGYALRFDFLCVNYPDVPNGYEEQFKKYSPETYRATGIAIDNKTVHPVVLGKLSENNHIVSTGPIRNDGSENTLSKQPMLPRRVPDSE